MENNEKKTAFNSHRAIQCANYECVNSQFLALNIWRNTHTYTNKQPVTNTILYFHEFYSADVSLVPISLSLRRRCILHHPPFGFTITKTPTSRTHVIWNLSCEADIFGWCLESVLYKQPNGTSYMHYIWLWRWICSLARLFGECLLLGVLH